MKLKTNSWHAKLHNFVYTNDLPQNLCPYFWKVLLAIALFIPCVIIQLPGLIIGLFSKEKLDSGDRYAYGGVTWFLILVLILFSSATFNLVKMLIGAYSYKWDVAVAGIFIWGLIILISSILGIRYLLNKRSEKEKEPSIIIEFFKAKKNKYCPKIDWN